MPDPSTDNGWAPLVLTRDRMIQLWQQMTEFPALADFIGAPDAEALWGLLMDKRNIFVDIGGGAGIGIALGVAPGRDAQVMFLMFDHQLGGREAVFADILRYWFRLVRLQRVTALTPAEHRPLAKLWKRLGFTREGVLRRACKWDGAWQDVLIDGLLVEDVGNAVAAYPVGGVD